MTRKGSLQDVRNEIEIIKIICFCFKPETWGVMSDAVVLMIYIEKKNNR